MNLSNDSAWDIKKEGHLNPNNIIFQDKKYIELYRNMKKQNDKIKRRKIKGKVIAVGSEVEDVNVGDRVIFPDYSGTSLVYNEEELLILNAKECLAVIKEKQ